MQLLRLFGIRIGVDASWFVVLFLAIFFLQQQFRGTVDGTDTTAYVAAVLAAFLFFGSILLHELGHAIAARREGIEVNGIDLFFFGGLMKMARDTHSPGAEFRVAVAGPLVTLLIVIVGGALGAALAGWQGFLDAALLREGEQVTLPLLLLSFLVPMNMLLLVFNLVPAYPLDGGRIARAAVWKITGDRSKATRTAAVLGRGFGFLLIAYGLYLLLARDATFSGLWLAVLGWLLAQSARGALAHTAFTERLEGVTVADIMDSEPVTIPAETPAAQAYEEYFLRYYGYDWFAVVDAAGRYVGRARRTPIETVAGGSDRDRPVRDFIPHDDEGQVRADTPLEALLGNEPLSRLGALMAVDDTGRLRGVVTVEQVSRALRARLAPQG
jgi:Zn-dependent protease/CBS domain-containing protein